jgi:hypothetical protein
MVLDPSDMLLAKGLLEKLDGFMQVKKADTISRVKQINNLKQFFFFR